MKQQIKYYLTSIAILISAGFIINGQFSSTPVNRWTKSAELGSQRVSACSVQMTDGRVLIAGGRTDATVLTSVEISGQDGTFSPAAPMAQARASAACIALPNGRVLVTGGSDGSASLASAEVYDSANDTWTSLGNMSVARTGHSATATPWGAVLLAGGEETGTVEMYLTNGTFTTLGTLAASRANYAITATAGHKVVIAGGSHGETTLSSVEIYDGDTGRLIPGGTMLAARKNLAASPLLDGSVLLTGGYGANGAILATSEIFDPEHGTSTAGPAMLSARANHKANVLPSNGRVLLIGGTDENGVTASAETYVPWTGKFAGVPPMHSARQQMAAAPLRRGALVVAGGQGANGALAGTEVFGFATLDTDKDDYAPGEQATFTGTGWKPGEQVLLQVSAFPLDQHSIEFTAAAQADSAGRIRIFPFNVDRSHAGGRFLAIARGSESTAQNVFTDAEATTTTLNLSSPTNTWGIPVTPSGHVQSSGPTNPVNAGTIAVSVDGLPPYSTPAITPATGDYTAAPIGGLAPGQHSFVAVYSGGGAPPWTTSTSAAAAYLVTTTTSTTLNTPVHLGTGQLGTSVAFNATVIGFGGAPSPTNGTVNFIDTTAGNALLATAAVGAGGVASTSLSNLTVKAYGVAAIYIPVANNGYSGSQSGTNTYAVTRRNPIAMTTIASPASQTVGQSVAFTSCVTAVAGITPTGSISFTFGSPISGPVAMSGGCATFNYSMLTGGASILTVTYSGDTNYRFNGIGVGDLALNVAKAATVSSVTSIPATPIAAGVPIQFIGTVTSSATANNGFQIGGASNATFQDNGVDIPSCSLLTVNNGSVTCNLPSGLAAGTHLIKFNFLSADPNFLPSSSPDYPATSKRIATAGALTVIPASPIAYNTAATARVQFGPSGGGPALTGTVSFYDGAIFLGSSPVVSGGNTDFVLPNFVIRGIGSHNLTAQYDGDAGYFTSLPPLATTLVVNQATPTLTPSTPAGTLTYGSSQTFSATVTSPAGTPTGTLTFSSGAVTLGTVTLPANSITINLTQLPPGVSPIRVTYGGDVNFAGVVDNSTSVTIGKATPSGSVTSTPASPVSAGAPLTLTATFTPPAAGTLTGTVNFFDGATQLNPVGVGIVGGQASFSLSSPLATGSHPAITAVYGGDTNFNVFTTANYSLTVNAIATTLSTPVSSAGASYNFGGTTTFTAVVSPHPGVPAFAGAVQFFDGITPIGSPIVPNAATGSVTSIGLLLTVGAHAISAQFAGDSNFVASASGTLSVSVGKAPTSVSTPFLSAGSATTPNSPMTFSSTVTSLSGGGVPGGTVTFTVDGVAQAPVGLNASGTGIITVSLGAGNHTISAVYSGDANFQNASSGTLTQSVNAPPPPTPFDPKLVVTIVPNPPTIGQSTAISVRVTGGDGPPPGGTVQILDGTTSLGTLMMVNGQAVLTTTFTTGGNHVLTIKYSGDSIPDAIAFVSVFPTRIQPSLTLTSNLSASVYGQPVALTAKVVFQAPPGVSPPSGLVQLFDGGVLIATGTLSQSTVTFNVASLGAGPHQLTASYPGDSIWFNANAPAVSQLVAKAQTALTLTALPDVSASPQVTVTATVGVVTPGGGIPTGTVQFVDSANNLILGTAPVTGGTATATLPEPNANSRTITAIYSGTPNYIDSKSPDVTHISIANAAGFNNFHASDDEIMSIFGANLASGTASATAVPLPLSLAGSTVKVTDQAGVEHPAGLYFASPTQINLLIPPGIPLGPIRVTVTNSNGDQFPILTLATVTAPGIFAANANGNGIAAAHVLRVHADGTFALENVAKLDPVQKTFVAAPISFGSDQLYLTLYGTGIRHTPGQSNVTVTINGQSVPILYAGAQPTFVGLDQINVPLSRSLAGTGSATIVVQVDGQTTNSVNVVFQ